MDMELSDSSDESTSVIRRNIQRARVLATSSDETSNDSEPIANELNDNSMEEDVESDLEEVDLDDEWQEIRLGDQAMNEYPQDEELLIDNTDCDDPISLYNLFFTDHILEMIVEETNRYAVQCMNNSASRSRRHQLAWKPVTKDELNIFIGIMGVAPLPEIRLYWSQKDMYTNVRIRNAMKRDWFISILRYLHFTDNSTARTEDPIGIFGDVAMTLLQPNLGKGHTVITDNWYTSPRLYTLLHKNKTNAFGTVRKSRKEMPHMDEKLKRGEICYESTDILLAMKWHDKKEVWILSSAHAATLIETEKRDYRTGLNKKKLSCIADYNSNMGAVDRVDMILSTLNSVRKSVKWYKKLFFHLLDLAIYNAYILYQNSTGSKQKFSEFHIALIKDILRKYPQNRSMAGGEKRKSEDLPFRAYEDYPGKKNPTEQQNNEKLKKIEGAAENLCKRPPAVHQGHSTEKPNEKDKTQVKSTCEEKAGNPARADTRQKPQAQVNNTYIKTPTHNSSGTECTGNDKRNNIQRKEIN
ncbi:unnamed protein product [Xylocopa violacea]|uniref:PiggyBac transposable element-derived protein domain-containing protein n=1 Tax=Xylocopa violacea TaxID=135666 RepID=A0ABP1NCT2_XYLVO